MNKDTYIFIDIQGFNYSFGYIPKELAIYDGIRSANFLFKPPFDKKVLPDDDMKMVSWAEEYHGLEWDFGNIDLNEINGILNKVHNDFKKPIFFLKGNEKAKFLKKYVDEGSIYAILLVENQN